MFEILSWLLIVRLCSCSLFIWSSSLSSFFFSLRVLNTNSGYQRGSFWYGELPVEKICRLFVHKVGENLSLGHGRAIQNAQILHSFGHYLYRCFLHWSHWCCHHWTTLQGSYFIINYYFYLFIGFFLFNCFLSIVALIGYSFK